MAVISSSDAPYYDLHAGDDRRNGIIVSNIICYVVSVVAVLLRVFSRSVAKIENRADDWWIWGALFLYTIYISIYQVLVHFGLGRHPSPATNFKGFALTSIFGAIAYNLTMLSIKFSIIYFYHRIFPQRWFKHALIATGAIVAGTAVSQIPISIVPCTPINSQWDSNVEGKCINLGAAILGIAISNIVTDVILLTLPMPLLWRLHVSASQRRLLISIFLLGGCACIVSFVRVFFVQQAEGRDPTWDYVKTAELSTVELGIGILSACLPTCRPLYNYFFLKDPTYADTRGRSKTYAKASKKHRGIRMTDMNRGWYSDRETLRSGNGENFHTALVSAHKSAPDPGDENYRRQKEREDRILVTREFTTESVGSS